MARFCTRCGKQLREGDSFCLGCGAPISKSGAPVGSPMESSAPASSIQAMPFTSVSARRTIEVDSESDMATTEVWQVPVEKTPNHADPFVVEVPKDELKPPANGVQTFRETAPEIKGGSSSTGLVFDEPGSSSKAIDPLSSIGNNVESDDCDESPTIVAQPIIEDDDEDESPTIVVARERYVLVRDSDGQRTELSLPCILGRGRAADKRVKGNPAISRKHAKVFQEDGLILIQDLGSTNGTFVNGSELKGDQCEPLSDGVAIRLGTEDFVLSIETV